MNNIEGDYDEILDWMDEHPVNRVEHACSRGEILGYEADKNGKMVLDDRDEPVLVIANAGLFSSNLTSVSKGNTRMYFSDNEPWANYFDTIKEDWKIEDFDPDIVF